ncbi:MAG: hypothetical protein ABSH39_04255 [Candidatus Acidiferrum sp.]
MTHRADRTGMDRRNVRRFQIKAALRVRVWKSLVPEHRAESVDLSERGIFFVTNTMIRKGQAVEILLKMPEEITGEPPTEWRCIGPAVRVEQVNAASGKIGVGVRFACYEVARCDHATPALNQKSARAWPHEPKVSMNLSMEPHLKETK